MKFHCVKSLILMITPLIGMIHARGQKLTHDIDQFDHLISLDEMLNSVKETRLKNYEVPTETQIALTPLSADQGKDKEKSTKFQRLRSTIDMDRSVLSKNGSRTPKTSRSKVLRSNRFLVRKRPEEDVRVRPTAVTSKLIKDRRSLGSYALGKFG